MDEVERFMGPISSSLRPEADGQWVRYSDYESAELALAAERLGREEAEAQRDSLRSQMETEVAHWRALADLLDVPEAIDVVNIVANRLQAILDSTSTEGEARG